MNLTIIIPYYNGGSAITKLLDSLPSDLPIIIIDDQSEKPLNLDPGPMDLKVIRPQKKGYFSGAVNRAAAECSTDFLILNQDVLFEGIEWLDVILENRERYAMIGERIKGNHPAYPNGYVHGTFMFIRRDAWKKVGKFNQIDYPLWGSTCEWQLRACRKGFEVLPLKEIPGFVHSRSGRFGDAISQILQEQPDKKNLFIRTPPMISVIVPCYNYGRYLPDLINSFIGGLTSLGNVPGQTFQSFEIIIADDGSTDNTQEIGESLHDPWKGIFYHRCPINGGTAYAANYAIKQSNAPYITRMDADDMRDSTSLESLFRTLIKNPHSFVYDDVILFVNGKRKKKIWKFQEFDFDELLWKNHVHAGIMFEYRAWQDTGGYPEVMDDGRDDWAFNIALGRKGYCGIRVNNPGYLYRREGQNRTLTNTTPVRRAEFLAKIKNIFPDVYKGERPMGCCGGGSKSKTVSLARGAHMGTYPEAPALPGAKGMMQVEYLGGNYGLQTYYGPATGTAYSFSVKHNKRNIDVRDAYFEHYSSGKGIGILELVDKGRPLFRQVKVAKAKAKAPAPAKVAPAPPPPPPPPEPEVELTKQPVIEVPATNELIKVGLSTKDLEPLLEAGYGIASILSETNKSMQERLGWGYGRVKKVKDIVKEYQANVQ